MEAHPIVGFGFRPTEVELICHYLYQKILGYADEAIKEVNIYDFEPKDLPLQSVFPSTDHFWYFVCARDANAAKQVRQARGGRWKMTGKPVYIKDEHGDYCQKVGTTIGYKNVLTFMPDKKVDDSKSKSTQSVVVNQNQSGSESTQPAVLQQNKSGKSTRKSPKPTSEWVIHEYSFGQEMESYSHVICRLQYKSIYNSSGSPTDHTDLAMEIAPVNVNPTDAVNDQSYQVNYEGMVQEDSVFQNYIPMYDAFEIGESSNLQHPQVDDSAGNLQGPGNWNQEDPVLEGFQGDWMDNLI